MGSRSSNTAETDRGWSVLNMNGSRIEIDPDRVVNLTDVPWQSLRRAFRWVKKTFVTSERSAVQSLRVDAGQTEIRELLGRNYFEPNWEFSTYYAGEQLNLRRVRYEDRDGLTWWQVHVRGFQTSEAFELDPHWEPEPTQHPTAHLGTEHIDVERGIEAIERILEAEKVPYERVSPGENGASGETPDSSPNR